MTSEFFDNIQQIYNHCALLCVEKLRTLRAWIEVFEPSNCAPNSNYSKIFHLNIDAQV